MSTDTDSSAEAVQSNQFLIVNDGHGALIDPGGIMTSNKACRLWAAMVRNLEIDSIVPQHGRSFVGKDMVNRFINWVESLECGVDLMTQEHYKVP